MIFSPLSNSQIKQANDNTVSQNSQKKKTHFKTLDLSPFFRPVKCTLEIDLKERELLNIESYFQLIKNCEVKKLPFILALVKTKEEGDKNFYHYFEATALRSWLDKREIKTHPITLKPIGKILYFQLESVTSEFTYLGFENTKKVKPEEVKPDHQEFLTVFFKAYLGDGMAQLKLAKIYKKKIQDKNFLEKRLFWLKKSAKQGNSEAQQALNDAYYFGEGTSINYEKAFYWAKKAASQENSNGEYDLGLYYYHGNGVEKDFEKSATWLKKAAKQKHPLAQNLLGRLYYLGRGVKKQNLDKAYYYFKKSARQENDIGQFNLACFYKKGYGVERDEKKAFTWMEKAANQNLVQAIYNLGIYYEKEIGVQKSQEKAHALFVKAAELGYEKAKRKLEQDLESEKVISSSKKQKR